MSKMQSETSEREKASAKEHAADMDELRSRHRVECDQLKGKYQDETRAQIDSYETKLTDLNLK